MKFRNDIFFKKSLFKLISHIFYQTFRKHMTVCSLIFYVNY